MIDVTAFFSRAGTSALPTVIPAMDKLDQILTDCTLNTTLKLPVCTSCKLAKQTLNWYYAKTDLSETYQIAMSKFQFISLLAIFAYSS